MPRDCPPQLADLITLANLPAARLCIDLPDIWPTWMRSTDPNAIAEAAAYLPPTFRTYLGSVDGSSDASAVLQAVLRWDAVHRAQHLLDAMIEAAATAAPIDLSHIGDLVRVSLCCDSAGRLTVMTSTDLLALNGVDASRLARCARCHRFVWQQRRRIDGTCSNACRQAIWRERHPDAYRDQQIASEQRRAEKEPVKKRRS
jgi:hypothetical protein